MSGTCYCDILKAASRRLSSIYDKALEPAGVNVAQYSLLQRIRRAGGATLTELGRIAELDRSTIGRNVRVLERMGLARLGRGADQREAVVTLTEAGRQALAIGTPLWDQAQAGIEARLGPTGVKELCTALQDL